MILDYVQITANVNVSSLPASPDVILTGNPLVFDGATQVKVEFYAQVVEIPAGYYDFNLGLYQDGALTRLLVGRFHDSHMTSPDDVEAYGLCYLTPAAGTHTFSIRAYRSAGSPSSVHAIVAAGDGVGDDFPPAFYSVQSV